MVVGWHADRESNSMTARIKPVELRDRRIFSPEHQANAIEESEALDIFTPVREDYEEQLRPV